MFKKLLQTTMVCALAFISISGVANAAMKKQPLKGMVTSVAKAKNLAVSTYLNGTNIVVTNWGPYTVDVSIAETGELIKLYGKSSYYVYSLYPYYDVWIDVFDSATHQPIFSGTVENPGTLDIDSPFLYGAVTTKAGQAHKFVVHKKSGL